MICRIYDVKGGKIEHYEAVRDRVGTDKPDGAKLHVVGATQDGIKVIEVWDTPPFAEVVSRWARFGSSVVGPRTDLPEVALGI
jgi:hypothetical protein